MKKIEPYKNVEKAVKSLDNGGKFYKIQTKANDGIIDQFELANVAGTASDKQKMILFLEMSILELEESEKTSVFSKLDSDLIKTYEKFKPKRLTPEEADFEVKLSSNVIVTGIPELIDSSSNFKGLIMFPIMLGNIATFKKTPLMDEYDVYKLKDKKSLKNFLIAHPIKSEKLPNKKMTIGGVMKTLITGDGGGKYLEIIYYFEH